MSLDSGNIRHSAVAKAAEQLRSPAQAPPAPRHLGHNSLTGARA